MDRVSPFKRLRERAGDGVTQRQIAEKLNKTVTTIGNYERCESAPSLDEVDNLATAYRVNRDLIEQAIVETNRIIRNSRSVVAK